MQKLIQADVCSLLVFVFFYFKESVYRRLFCAIMHMCMSYVTCMIYFPCHQYMCYGHAYAYDMIVYVPSHALTC